MKREKWFLMFHCIDPRKITNVSDIEVKRNEVDRGEVMGKWLYLGE